MARLTYKDAGVDIDKFEEALGGLEALMRRTYEPRVIANDNGFAGLFRLNPDRLFGRPFRDPVIVGCTDGVGTKLKVAFLMDRHDTVGIDLVAMNVNDLICVGAYPLFFVDYVATAKLDPDKLFAVIRGMCEGCRRAECALISGETAEMPGFYAPGEYDLAGFAVGAMERNRRIDGRRRLRAGDVVIGLASSGLHSNGYSLARKVLLETARMKVDQHVPELGRTLGEELLEPTRIYVRSVSRLFRSYRHKRVPHGVANITGGGLPGKIGRILPDRCTVRLRKKSWPVPPIFEMIRRLGDIEEAEMYRAFNMGVGMAVIVPPFYADSVLRQLERAGEKAFFIGEVVTGERAVVIE